MAATNWTIITRRKDNGIVVTFPLLSKMDLQNSSSNRKRINGYKYIRNYMRSRNQQNNAKKMIKKKKKQNEYIFRNKKFTTFEEMKTYAYFNMSVGTKEKALEINEDEIIKKYELIKQKRRLLCIKTYDVIEEYKKWIEKQQLKLFEK